MGSCCCKYKAIVIDHPHGGVMTVHKYQGKPTCLGNILVRFGTPESTRFKTGMNVDFSGKLNFD